MAAIGSPVPQVPVTPAPGRTAPRSAGKAGLLCVLLAVLLYVFGAAGAAGMVRWLAIAIFVAGVVLAGIATSEPD